MEAREHLYWLDWPRFIAAFMVVATHARGGNWVDWSHLGPASHSTIAELFFVGTRTGLVWVTVFFVLSGFLVGGKVMERVCMGTFSALDYTIDRFTRIWLPLAPSLVWTWAVAWLVGIPHSFLIFMGNLLGLQGVLCDNFGENLPLWSLSFEIWFYVMAGCAAGVLTCAGSRGQVWAFLGLSLSFAAFTQLDDLHLLCWLLGAFSYRFRNLDRIAFLALLGGLLTATGYLISQLRTETESADFTAWAAIIPTRNSGIFILALGLALLFPCLIRLRPTTVLAGNVERLGARLAAFSYTLYLTHYPLLFLWDQFGPSRFATLSVASLLLFGIKLISCLLAAWLFYLPFEAQTPVVRKWLRSKLRPPKITPAEGGLAPATAPGLPNPTPAN